MKTFYSEIMIKDILDMFSEHINVIRIILNNKVVWDDSWDIHTYYKVLNTIKNKRVYYFKTNICNFHDCELIIVGD